VLDRARFSTFFYFMKLKIKNRYGITPNHILNSNQLTLSAKGLYGYIQSKPDGWEFSAEKIASQNRESPKVINKYLKELETAGLLQRNKKSGGKGIWIIEYVLTDTFSPLSSNENTSNENTSNENGTNNSNKEFSKKDISNKDDDDEVKKKNSSTPPQNNSLSDNYIEIILQAYGEVKGWELVEQLHKTDNAKQRFEKFHMPKIKTKHEWAKHFVNYNQINFEHFCRKQKFNPERTKVFLRKFITDLIDEKRNDYCMESEFIRHFKNWINKQ
jgi:hypothetical protein